MTRDNQPRITPASVSEILREEPSLYSTQFATGFRSLTFLPELEQEFRQFYLSNSPGQLKRVLPVALVLTLLFMMSDYLRLSAETLQPMLMVRVPQFLSLGLLTLVVYRDWSRWLEPTVALTLITYGVTTPIIMGQINAVGAYSPIAAQLLILVFCYFLAGLRFFRAMAVALVISVSYPLSQALFEEPIPHLALNCYFLLAFNLLGLAGAYFIEYTARESYLGRQLLGQMALYDSLTGLSNRRAFTIDLDKICLQARRDKVGLAVAMADVDHFKEFNDYFGHLQGDDCLQRIAGALQAAANRPLDKVGRYGGEEFILMWYDCNESSARELAEAARQSVTSLQISHGPGATQRRVTISLGVATCGPEETTDASSLIRAADRALYRAKEAGRDRVVLDSDSD